MNTRRSLALALVAFVAAIVAPPSRAEVSAEVDATGNYVKTVILANASTKNVRIWTVVRSRSSFVPLNPEGDLNGDLWPTIRDNVVSDGLPWAVWSRFNGTGFDIAWSRFQGGAWSPIRWIGSGSTAGDDLDPSLSFDPSGRPHIAWWRNEGGKGRVYLSLFLVTKWMNAIPVSDDGVDSVNPMVTVLSDYSIQVEFDTPAGHVTRVIQFSRPTTITDDITPFNPTVTAEYTTKLQ